MTIEYRRGKYIVTLDCACCKGLKIFETRSKRELNKYLDRVVPESEIIRPDTQPVR